MRFSIGYILLFCLYFILHYIEGFSSVGGLSIAQLWKMPVLLLLLFYVVPRFVKVLRFERSCYLLAGETLLGPEFIINPLWVITNATKLLPVVLLFRFWISRFAKKKETLITFMYVLAQFVCLTSFVTLIGLISPLQEVRYAESVGIEGLSYYSSIFGSFHAASSYFCMAILVLIHGFYTRRFFTLYSKCFNIVLIIVAFVSIYKAYVRTGWLMLLVGLFFLLGISKISVKKVITRVVPIIAISTLGLLYFYNTDEAFQARLTGRNVYTGTGSDGLDTSGSGRTQFWVNGIKLWATSGPYEFFFGNGFTKVTENNMELTGMNVFSHNQFVDILAQNGLVGLILLILFNVNIFRFLRRTRSDSSYRRLGMAFFWSNLVFSFFQNEMYFDFAIMFSIVLAINYLEQKEVKSRI